MVRGLASLENSTFISLLLTTFNDRTLFAQSYFRKKGTVFLRRRK